MRLPLHHSATCPSNRMAPTTLWILQAPCSPQKRSLVQCIVRAQHVGRVSQCCTQRMGWYRLAPQSIAHIHQYPKPTCAARIPNSARTVHRSKVGAQCPTHRINSLLPNTCSANFTAMQFRNQQQSPTVPTSFDQIQGPAYWCRLPCRCALPTAHYQPKNKYMSCQPPFSRLNEAW